MERAADWQSLGSGSAVVGKLIGDRSRLSESKTSLSSPCASLAMSKDKAVSGLPM